jgi:hypothetical protein
MAHGALLPTLSARPNPQVWYTGSAVDQDIHEDGHVFGRIRERGIKGEDPALLYLEWSAEAEDPESLSDALAATRRSGRKPTPDSVSASRTSTSNASGGRWIRARSRSSVSGSATGRRVARTPGSTSIPGTRSPISTRNRVGPSSSSSTFVLTAPRRRSPSPAAVLTDWYTSRSSTTARHQLDRPAAWRT